MMLRIEGAKAPIEEPVPRKPIIPCCPDDDPDDRCRHIKLGLKAVEGTLGIPDPDDDEKTRRRVAGERGLVELNGISRSGLDVPKCPSCGETWSVSLVGENVYSCRSPVCRRKDKRGVVRSWKFTPGEDNKMPQAGRHEWVFDWLDGKRLR